MLICVCSSLFTIAQVPAYSIASKAWDEGLGNHRATIRIDKKADIASLKLDWRRPDREVGNHQFIIISSTGDTIKNIFRQTVNNECCQLLFGPVKQAGTYYFYYLPYQVQAGHGGYSGDYIRNIPANDPTWEQKIKAEKKYPAAQVLNIEARTPFDSFYPMEVIATTAEQKKYTQNTAQPFYIFPEDRLFPIRMQKNLPLRWMTIKQKEVFHGEAHPNEYYAFQLGVWSPNHALEEVTYQVSDLKCGNKTIPATAITCFNAEGIDPYGTPFKKRITVNAGDVQALWFGIDVAQDQAPGEYQGKVTITDKNSGSIAIPLHISVKGDILADRGDSEPLKHSRLRWLNSTLGISDTPTSPYTAINIKDTQISCLGRDIELNVQTGLPQQIQSWGNNILQSPIRFIIETNESIKKLEATSTIKETTNGHVTYTWEAEDNDLKLSYQARMEFDGWVNYIYTVTPKRTVNLKDIRLEIPMKKNIASYILGMGLPGQETPHEYQGKWDTPYKNINNIGLSIPVSEKQEWLWPFDSFWMGNSKAGLHCELRGSVYTGPLLNLYHPAYPQSWYNGGKGGFSVKQENEYTCATIYSGERQLITGQPITFDFALLITPVKQVNTHQQFTDRYYHNGGKPVPTLDDVKAGVKIINVHHANEYNPFINYPFLTVNSMKQFTHEWHEKGCKVKLYYTLRELTNSVAELWAIRSLGNEILRGGNGGGFPWCREHLISGYTPQWYHHFEDINQFGIQADAALLTAESDSRWYNYYVEGLAWMVKNLDIDGIYMDDVSFDRRILKRIRRAMDAVKPGCLIDLHSNTGFSKGPANQYTEFFPYVDKLWFGESFMYSQMAPVNWLVEASGIPFGLMSDMLHGGGNKWLGMQYGMTVRHPWLTEGVICDPRLIWKIWDDFNIADSQMIGFWEDNTPVNTNNANIRVTTYLKPGEVLLSIGNYTDTTSNFHLKIDWQKLGLDPNKIKLIQPGINDFQNERQYTAGEEISIEPRKGLLIYIKQQ